MGGCRARFRRALGNRVLERHVYSLHTWELQVEAGVILRGEERMITGKQDRPKGMFTFLEGELQEGLVLTSPAGGKATSHQLPE